VTPRYHPASQPKAELLWGAVTGFPVTGYCEFTGATSPQSVGGAAGEFSRLCSAAHAGLAPDFPDSLTDGLLLLLWCLFYKV